MREVCVEGGPRHAATLFLSNYEGSLLHPITRLARPSFPAFTTSLPTLPSMAYRPPLYRPVPQLCARALSAYVGQGAPDALLFITASQLVAIQVGVRGAVITRQCMEQGGGTGGSEASQTWSSTRRV